jgi:hypothetical protein
MDVRTAVKREGKWVTKLAEWKGSLMVLPMADSLVGRKDVEMVENLTGKTGPL